MSSLALLPRTFGEPRFQYEATINADPISVRDAILTVMERLRLEFPPQLEGIISTEIVLAEVLNNIVEHGYEDSNLGDITISALCRDDVISIETRDYGLPMPGLEVPQTELDDAPIEVDELPEGGFGWFFIRSLSSHMEYRRIKDENIFCVQVPTVSQTFD